MWAGSFSKDSWLELRARHFLSRGPGESGREPAMSLRPFFTRVRVLGTLQGGVCPPAGTVDVIIS